MRPKVSPHKECELRYRESDAGETRNSILHAIDYFEHIYDLYEYMME